MQRNIINNALLNRRNILGACLGAPILACAQNANALGLSNLFGAGKNKNFDTSYHECLGVPLAVFKNVQIQSFDNSHIDVRIAAPAEAPTARMPIIACCTDDAPGPDYDLMTGSIAQKGYLILTVSYASAKINNSDAFSNSRRAQYLRFMLDRLPEILNAYGVDKRMVDRDKIGVAGHGEGAWTALELIGYGRGLRSNSTIADGRISSSFALMPTPFKDSSKSAPIMNNDRIYGQGIIAGDLSSLPPPPKGSGLLGLGLPTQSPAFGGLLGKKRNKNSEPNQREILAAACAAANMFFDWTLKGQKEAYEQLIALDGKKLPNISTSLTMVKA
jgi:hypothetical protein